METAALQNSNFAGMASPMPAATRRGAPGFAESLASTLKPGDDEKQAQQQQAREASQQLVASAFLTPLFDQLRNSGFKTKYFDGGQGEDAFMQRLHTRLADRMVQRGNLPIVDAVARFVTQHGRTAPTHAQTGTQVDRHG